MSTPKDMHAELMRLMLRCAASTEDGFSSHRDTFSAYARTLTDRIAELEAQLAAVVAGGMGAMVPPKSAHVGDSNFESWFSEYSPAGRGTKQQMRDSYAAGMGDPAAQPAPAVVGPGPLAYLICGALFQSTEGLEQDEWEIDAERGPCERLSAANPGLKIPLYFAPPPHQIAEPASRPVNCGTGFCSCIECLFEARSSHPKGAIMSSPLNDNYQNMAANAICHAAAMAGEAVQQAVSCHGEPSAIYRPKLSIDGDQWCALYGDNLQNGVAGFGKSPADAMAAFNTAWYAPLKDKS